MNYITKLFWKYRLRHTSRTFWPEGYKFLYMTPDAKDYEAFADFVKFGEANGRCNGIDYPKDVFYDEGYLTIYSDVEQSGTAPWRHYVLHGYKDGRLNGTTPPEDFFFPEGYLLIYNDVKDSGIAPWEHFCRFGKNEGRCNGLTPPKDLFYSDGYLVLNPDVKEAGKDPWKHYVLYGRAEGRSNGIAPPAHLFYPEGYELIYNDVKQSGLDPWHHYASIGYNQKRCNGKVPPADFFFPEGYLTIYDDVRKAGGDPWIHYVKKGNKEGRNNGLKPSLKFFNPKKYLDFYTDVADSSIDPWRHYVLYGQYEGRNRFGDDNDLIFNCLSYDLLLNSNYENFENVTDIDIILPIYNGAEFLNDLFNSIKRNTDLNYTLFIINDASPDPLVQKIIDSNFSSSSNVVILNNNQNLGFVKSVNKALKLTHNHVVLLNSDVVLPEHWASRLLYPIFSDNKVASVTPFSNAATIFSIPEINKNNTLEVDLEKLNNSIANLNVPFNDIHFATGVGFCMAMNRAAIDMIGCLDEVFEKGYGEENDWCQRAIKSGFYNTIAGNLYVWHKHGGSFDSEEKKNLVSKHVKILNDRYNDYAKTIEQNYKDQLFLSLRFLINIFYFNFVFGNTIVVFDHSIGGGTESYVVSKINQKRSTACVIRVQYFKNEYKVTVYCREHEEAILFKNLDEIFLLLKINIPKMLVINNLFNYNIFDVISRISLLKKIHPFINVVFCMHDYQCICPTINMIDNNGYYCNNIGNRNLCSQCYKNIDNPELLYPSIKQYQDQYRILLKNVADKILVFSNNSLKITKFWFDVDDNRIELIPHSVDDLRKVVISKHHDINVAVVGNIGFNKGFRILQEIDSVLDQYPDLSFYVIGKTVKKLKNIKVLGSYNTVNLPEIAEKLCIDIVLFPSVWPETFSYVCSEVISMGLPIVCFPLGAQMDKIENYDKGFIIESTEATDILHFLKNKVQDIRLSNK